MQARKKKYQRDKRGYIIEEIKEKEDNKGKGKLNEGTMISKNKFGALEVEEEAQPIMQITDGKGEARDKALGQDQISKENSKEKQLENNGNKKGTSPNPTANGIGEGISGKSAYKEGGKMSLNKEEVEARKIKKEAVEKVNMVRESGNILSDTSNDAATRKEQTIEWVHRRFGTKDINKVNSAQTLCAEVEVMESQRLGEEVLGGNGKGNNAGQTAEIMGAATVNPSNCQTRVEDNSSYMVNQAEVHIGKDQGVSEEARKQEGSAQQLMNKEKGNGTVNPSQSGEILAFVDGVPVYSLEKDLDGDVPTEAIVARDSGELESLPVACASGTGSPIQIQLNMPLRTPNQVLHDIITHKELPDDIQQTLIEQQLQFEGEEDDESTAENFKAIAKERDLSPKSAARSGKKGKKNQPKELQAPTRILPRRAAFNVSR
ncbi:hypothetical protein A4A49_08114 [Nicotiana attenuata]|uniref:Uncharacterized protein n=1 Tax=Nicotiana attenuata TaxID=49451 RepID=A0A314KTX2_NICAT|nr:hypothetical protein A4A49_08114 [Nicotiana attenuata]